VCYPFRSSQCNCSRSDLFTLDEDMDIDIEGFLPEVSGPSVQPYDTCDDYVSFN
jgi:hypothetical protein